MRQITEQAREAFIENKRFKKSNTEVKVLNEDYVIMFLFGNAIAFKNVKKNTAKITSAGFRSNTTKARLNGIPNVNIRQKKGIWYLNSKVWDGNLIEIKL